MIKYDKAFNIYVVLLPYPILTHSKTDQPDVKLFWKGEALRIVRAFLRAIPVRESLNIYFNFNLYLSTCIISSLIKLNLDFNPLRTKL